MLFSRSKSSSEIRSAFLHFPESSRIHAILPGTTLLMFMFGAKTWASRLMSCKHLVRVPTNNLGVQPSFLIWLLKKEIKVVSLWHSEFAHCCRRHFRAMEGSGKGAPAASGARCLSREDVTSWPCPYGHDLLYCKQASYRQGPAHTCTREGPVTPWDGYKAHLSSGRNIAATELKHDPAVGMGGLLGEGAL